MQVIQLPDNEMSFSNCAYVHPENKFARKDYVNIKYNCRNMWENSLLVCIKVDKRIPNDCIGLNSQQRQFIFKNKNLNDNIVDIIPISNINKLLMAELKVEQITRTKIEINVRDFEEAFRRKFEQTVLVRNLSIPFIFKEHVFKITPFEAKSGYYLSNQSLLNLYFQIKPWMSIVN